MSQRLDAIFEKRWQIYQSIAVEIVLCGRKGPNGKALVSQFDRGPDSGAITQEFASAFRDYGADIAAMPTDEAAKIVHESRIRASLIDGLNQWFLLDRTAPNLAALLDILEQLARQKLCGWASERRRQSSPSSSAVTE